MNSSQRLSLLKDFNDRQSHLVTESSLWEDEVRYHGHETELRRSHVKLLRKKIARADALMEKAIEASVLALEYEKLILRS